MWCIRTISDYCHHLFQSLVCCFCISWCIYYVYMIYCNVLRFCYSGGFVFLSISLPTCCLIFLQSGLVVHYQQKRNENISVANKNKKNYQNNVCDIYMWSKLWHVFGEFNKSHPPPPHVAKSGTVQCIHEAFVLLKRWRNLKNCAFSMEGYSRPFLLFNTRHTMSLIPVWSLAMLCSGSVTDTWVA